MEREPHVPGIARCAASRPRTALSICGRHALGTFAAEAGHGNGKKISGCGFQPCGRSNVSKEKRHAWNGAPLLMLRLGATPPSSPEPLPIVHVVLLRFSYGRPRTTFSFHYPCPIVSLN